jgi:dTDP-4-dehydrorhamnose reductase
MTLAPRSNDWDIAPVQHVLIVGGDSTIGSALSRRLLAEGYQVTCSTRRPGNHGVCSVYLDLHEPATFLSLQNRRFDTAVLCGAAASIRQCEESPEQTRLINVDGTLAVAGLLRDSGSHLVFLSTNMVFDGSKPYARASDVRSPVTEYGRQKALVEEALLAPRHQASVVRLGKVIPAGFSLFNEWLERLRTGQRIHPYYNCSMAPVSLKFVTDILLWVVSRKYLGVLQATASCDITYADAAHKLAQFVQADSSLIEPVKAPLCYNRIGTQTQIPAYTSLEFSPEFMHIFSAPSPEEALRYAIKE